MIKNIVIGKCRINHNSKIVASTSLAISSSAVKINLETEEQFVEECLHMSDRVISLPGYDEDSVAMTHDLMTSWVLWVADTYHMDGMRVCLDRELDPWFNDCSSSHEDAAVIGI